VKPILKRLKRDFTICGKYKLLSSQKRKHKTRDGNQFWETVFRIFICKSWCMTNTLDLELGPFTGNMYI